MNTKLLHEILHIETCSCDETMMREFVFAKCESLGAKTEIDKFGNVFATKGKSKTFPCYCAHLDTVHEVTGDGIAIITLAGKVTGLNPVTMAQTGIGGDDKCGIYAALNCLEHLPSCKVAFFSNEEIGCHGSEKFNVEWLEDCKFVIQADRRGNGDFVTDISGPLSSIAFQSDVAPILASYGYKPSLGAMSDVMALRDNHCGVSVANISAGYHNPHQACEFIVLDELDRACDLMLEIGRKLKSVYPFIYTRPKVNLGRSWWPKDTRVLDEREEYYRNGYNDDEIDKILGQYWR